LGRVRVTNIAVEKAISIINFERVVATLTKQHVERMRRIISSRVTCPASPYVSTLSQKRHDCRGEKIIKYKICVL